MFILVDTTNGRALARHAEYKALSALHYIQFANTDGAILRAGENRVYAQFNHQQLENMLRNAGQAQVPTDYTALIRATRALLEQAPFLLLPFTRQQLEEQAYSIDPNDGRPMAFDPNSNRPKLLRAWPAEPQANKSRGDSSFWIDFASGPAEGQSADRALYDTSPSATVRKRNIPPTTTEEDMAAKKPAKKAAKKAAKKTTAPAKKAAAKKAPAKRATTGQEQEERNGVKRPRPGGNTAAVWDCCDALTKKLGAAPSFKQLDEALEKSNKDIPTATRRSNYAVWRKFNGISGRVG